MKSARSLPKSDSTPAVPPGEEYLRDVLNSAHDFGIITLDTDGYVVTWNTGAEKLLGWSAEEIIGTTVEAIFTPEDCVNRVPQTARKIALETGSCAEERWFQRKNGTRFFASGKLAPIRDKSGQHIGFVKICRDLTEAVRQREELERSEERYRVLVELSPQVVWFADAKGNITFCNQRWCDLTGLRMEQTTGAGWLQGIMPEYRHRVLRSWYDAMRRGELYEAEIPVRLQDGAPRWHLARSTPVRDEAGAIVRWVGILLDIHERKKAEAAQAPFRVLFESAPGPYLVLEPEEFRIVAASDAYLRATMTERDQIMGRRMFEVYPDIPGDPLATGVRNLRASLERVKTERKVDVMAVQRYPIRRAEELGDGWDERWWSPVNSPVLGPDGDLLYIIHRVEDVTPLIREKRSHGKEVEGVQMLEERAEHMEAEVALRAQELQRLNEQLREEQQHVMFEISSAGLLQTDARDERILRVNDACCRITGYCREELLAMRLCQLTHPADREQDRKIYERARRGEVRSYFNEKRIVRKDGSVVWVRISAAFLRSPEGEPLRTFAVLEDVTDSKKAEHALQEADRRKTEFLAMLAHELRNPLAAVRNAVQVSQEDIGVDSCEWALEVINRQGEQLTRLVDDLLDVSRITRGVVILHKERVNAAAILDHAVEVVSPLIERRHHELIRSYDRSDAELLVEADPARLEQIIVNLLTNAAKYTPDGGCLELSAWVEESTPTHPSRRQVVISVRDNGIGIPPEKMPEMFELFAQGDRGLARSEGGLGIGLALVKKLTEMHGGTIAAHSKGVGRGSEFVVQLPISEKEAVVSPEKPRQEVKLSSGFERVLVVDDNKDSAEGMARLLRRRGFTVDLAFDGHEAVEKAHTFDPHVVLLDIGLPGLSGYEVVAQLHRDHRHDETLFIAMSGYGQEEDQRRSMEAGFDYHLVKPVDFERLREILATEANRR
ncbi:hybrid sensor histidine kinase/response regulator [Verrucomicrobiota bacterium sgz303538]